MLVSPNSDIDNSQEFKNKRYLVKFLDECKTHKLFFQSNKSCLLCSRKGGGVKVISPIARCETRNLACIFPESYPSKACLLGSDCNPITKDL